MSTYLATVQWQRGDEEAFLDNQYSRAHQWSFDGGVTVPASASPQVVPLPYSIEAAVDPEEAYVAALSSCHMLFFMSIAAKKRYVIDSYVDQAVGTMAKNDAGQMVMTEVELRPLVVFSGERVPGPDQIERIHELAHQQCFIANSVRSEIVIKPQ